MIQTTRRVFCKLPFYGNLQRNCPYYINLLFWRCINMPWLDTRSKITRILCSFQIRLFLSLIYSIISQNTFFSRLSILWRWIEFWGCLSVWFIDRILFVSPHSESCSQLCSNPFSAAILQSTRVCSHFWSPLSSFELTAERYNSWLELWQVTASITWAARPTSKRKKRASRMLCR